MSDEINKGEFLANQKKEKKPLFKNWKTYAIGSGIIVVGLGIGLGVGLGLQTSQTSNPSKQEIVDAINNQNYEIKAIEKDLASVTSKINADLIKTKLNNNIAQAFSSDLFKNPKVLITKDGKDVDLTADDLVVGQIKGKISYSYGEITNQTTKLTINVDPITDQNIVDAINNVKTYKITKPEGVEPLDIENNVDQDFIQKQLTDGIHDAFDASQLVFETNYKITVDRHKLSDIDLVVSKSPITAEINFTYGKNKISGTANLIIEITPKKFNDQEIVDAINQTSYKLTINSAIDGKVDYVKSQISKEQFEFIATQIENKEIANAFIPSSFELTSLTTSNHPLTEEDLTLNEGTENKTVDTIIGFTYGENKISGTTNLKIEITSKEFNNQEIVDAINQASYELTINSAIDEKVKTVNDQISKEQFEFITTQIENKEIANVFIPSSFELTSLTTSDHPLTEEDLTLNEGTENKTVDTIIGFTYGTNDNKIIGDTKLTITVELFNNISTVQDRLGLYPVLLKNSIDELQKEFKSRTLLTIISWLEINIKGNKEDIDNPENYDVIDVYLDEDHTILAKDVDIKYDANLFVEVKGINKLYGTLFCKIIIKDTV